ncbi:MAG: DNA methyltransferase [Bacillota bacterium]
MYPRLYLTRTLLREDGVIFISIDDHEVPYLRLLLHEIFGKKNFITTIIWEKKYTRANDARWFSDNHEYILAAAKDKDLCCFNRLERSPKQLPGMAIRITILKAIYSRMVFIY